MARGGDLKSQALGDLVDEGRLARWLDERGLVPAGALRVWRLAGGMSNESIAVERGGRRLVLRRPAKRALAGADRGMQREFRLLRALEGTPVPHPRPLALCLDREVAGCVFYLMEYVDGFVPGLDPLPQAFVRDAEQRRELLRSAARTLGDLARLDWRALGLADFGRPEGFHERQVGRWLRQLDGYPERAGRDLAPLAEVGAWLDEHRPAPDAWTPALMHGDYHDANLLAAPVPPGRIAAVLDWENATIGDPLLDLAGFLRLLAKSERAAWAPREELIACWEEHSGRAAPDLRYYTVLSAFKLSVMLEGVYRRSLGDDTRGSADSLGAIALELMHEARDTMAVR